MERPDFQGVQGWVVGRIAGNAGPPRHHFPIGTPVWINPKPDFSASGYTTYRAQGRTNTTKPFYQTVNEKDLLFADDEVSEDEESSAIASIMRGYASRENA